MTHASDVRGATRVDAMPADSQIHVVVSLKLRDKEGLDKLTDSLASGTVIAAPLTSAQFMARHAPTIERAQAVVDHLRAHGFTHVKLTEDRMLVEAYGSPAAVQEAFHAELQQFQVDGHIVYANVTDAQVPAYLGDTVLAVLGLQTIYLRQPHVRPFVPSAASPQSVGGISIPNFAAIYGATSLPSATRATIGIISVGTLSQTITDLNTFAKASGYPVPTTSIVSVGSASTTAQAVLEWNMDSQVALAAAGGTVSSIVFYNTGSFGDSDLILAFNKAVTDNKARVINVSLGGCELDVQASGMQATDDLTFQKAVAQGQTFSVSSGDDGAYSCYNTAVKNANKKAHADEEPATSPYVMALGGTSLGTTNGSVWASESVWSCSGFTACTPSPPSPPPPPGPPPKPLVHRAGDNGSGAGGGPSLTEKAPAWQAGVLGGSTMRGVPDISFDADPATGAIVLYGNGSVQVGGTSLAAPLFTGFYSRIQSANNNALPFPAATIYQGAAAHPQWFHDVTTGLQDFQAGKGWDYASGFGSLQIGGYAQSIAGAKAAVQAVITDYLLN